QPNRSAKMGQGSGVIAARSEGITEVVVRVEIVGPGLEGGVQARNRFVHSALRQQRCAERVVYGRVVRAKPQRFREVRDRLRKVTSDLQKRSEVVMRLEVIGILLQVVNRQSLLNERSRVDLTMDRPNR